MDHVPTNSDRIRTMINGVIAEANLTESAFARRLGGALAGSTLNRVLKTGQELSPFHVHVLLNAAARIAEIPVARLQCALRGTFSPVVVPEIELTVAKCLSADNSKLVELMREVSVAEAAGDQIIVFCRNLPLMLLEDELAQRIVDYLATRYARDPALAKTLLQETVAQRRDRFMNCGADAHQQLVVILPMSRLLAMAKLESPFSGCTRDQIGASLSSLLHDAVLGKNVTLVVLNDVVNRQCFVATYPGWRFMPDSCPKCAGQF